MSDLYIMHYGVGHDKGGHSGRYPWGSGKNPTYPKRYYGGVDTQVKGRDLLKITSSADEYNPQIDLAVLSDAKKYMKKTGKFITEDEMRYIKYRRGVSHGTALMLATLGSAAVWGTPGLGYMYLPQFKNKEEGKEFLKKYKYMDKYII